MKILKLLLLALALSTLFFSCNKEESSVFPLANEHNIDGEKLEVAYDYAESINGLGALIVEKDNVVIAERYFGNYTDESFFNIRSITKSITSILTGIAIDKEIIGSVDQKISYFIGDQIETTDPDKLNISIYHALTMSAGLYWNEWDYTNGFYNSYVVAPSQVNFLFNQDIVHTPGQVFTYNSALPHMLSIIIDEHSGLNTLDFAKQNLFQPLGIDTLDWYIFNNGYFNGGGDIIMRPKDLVKIGRLMINGGSYQGNQLVSSSWVDESTSNYISTNNSTPHGPNYAYWWWLGSSDGKNFYWGNGYGGQFLICIPEKNTVIVANSNHANTGKTASELWGQVEYLIMNKVIPCIN